VDALTASCSLAIVSGSIPQPEHTMVAKSGNTLFTDLNIVCFPLQDSNY
jgi:hypothetical protein